jgi:hypothetical protein
LVRFEDLCVNAKSTPHRITVTAQQTAIRNHLRDDFFCFLPFTKNTLRCLWIYVRNQNKKTQVFLLLIKRKVLFLQIRKIRRCHMGCRHSRQS